MAATLVSTNAMLRYLVERRCTQKRAHRHMAQALYEARRLAMRDGELMDAYKCCDCGAWHVGHSRDTRAAAEFKVWWECEVLLPRRQRRKERALAYLQQQCEAWENEGGAIL